MFNKPWELQLYAFRKLKIQYKLHIAGKERSVKENKIQRYFILKYIYWHMVSNIQREIDCQMNRFYLSRITEEFIVTIKST